MENLAEQTAPPHKLDFAYYVYLLRDDEAGIAAVRDFFARRYQIAKPREPAVLFEGIDGQSVHTTCLIDADSNCRIDLHLLLLSNVAVIQTLWFTPQPDADDRNNGYLNQLGQLEQEVSAAGSARLADTVIFIDRGQATTTAPVPSGQTLTASVDGARLSHTVADLETKRHYYVLQPSELTAPHQFLTADLPRLDWAIQRLRREVTYFNERRQTILSEKSEIDAAINGVLHQKMVASKPAASRRDQLEEEIGKLSTMYGKLATDLHLVKEARTMLASDVERISGYSRLFDGDPNAAVDFPGYYIARFGEHLAGLQVDEEDLRQSLDNAKAAIGIVQTQVELLRGGEAIALQEQARELLNQNVLLQQERISLQVAAQVVELVIIFYYTLKSWEAVAPLESVDRLHPGVKFGVVAVFSAAVVGLTHAIAKSIRDRRAHWPPLALSAAAALASLAAMVAFPLLLGK